MMTLFYAKGTCSLAPHIMLAELALAYRAVAVDLKSKIVTDINYVDKTDFYAINPRGCVPALLLADGQLITQNGAILLYLADVDQQYQFVPSPADKFARTRCHEWLFLLSADLHKSFGLFFKADTWLGVSEEAVKLLKNQAEKMIHQVLAIVEQKLQDKPFALGDFFSIIDAYLFVFYHWSSRLNISLDHYPAFSALAQKITLRPAVQKVLQTEGIQ